MLTGDLLRTDQWPFQAWKEIKAEKHVTAVHNLIFFIYDQ